MNSIKLFLVIIFSALITSCGGGGGGSSGGGGGTPAVSTITGTAAIGTPIAGQVTAIDSTGKTFTAMIGALGAYTVDVTGGTPPFILIVKGTAGGAAVSLSSVATAVGQTVNITSLTDLIVSTAAGQPGGAVLVNLCTPTVQPGCTAALKAATSGTNLALAVTAVTNMVAPLNTTNINPLNGAFVANGTGMDAVLNAILVTPASAQGAAATVTLVAVPAQQLGTVTLPTNTGGTAVAATVAPSASNIALAGIQATIDARSALFATSLPSSTDPNWLALFTSTFLNDGLALSAFLAQHNTDPRLIGSNFSNLVLDSLDTTTGTIAQVHFTPLDAAGTSIYPSEANGVIHWQMNKNASGVWQFDGDQRLAFVGVRTFAIQSNCNPQTLPACTAATSYKTGLWLGIIDNNATLANATVVVTGPGLPSAGVTLIPPTIAAKGFILTTANPNCVTGCSGTNVWFLTDADIAGTTTGISAVTANSVYTIKLYNSVSTLLATYTEVISVAPVLNTALAALAYPSITTTSPSLINLAGIGAITLHPSWTIPNGLAGGGIEVDLNQTGTNQDARVTADTLTSSGTASIVILQPTNLGTWTSGNYLIYEWDKISSGMVAVDYQ